MYVSSMRICIEEDEREKWVRKERRKGGMG
jgi:hypothetical protein